MTTRGVLWRELAEHAAGLTCIGPEGRRLWTPAEGADMFRAWEQHGAFRVRQELIALAMFAALMALTVEGT